MHRVGDVVDGEGAAPDPSVARATERCRAGSTSAAAPTSPRPPTQPRRHVRARLRRRHHQPPRCQTKGCNADLTGAKHSRCRHKVCKYHAKASVVAAGRSSSACSAVGLQAWCGKPAPETAAWWQWRLQATSSQRMPAARASTRRAASTCLLSMGVLLLLLRTEARACTGAPPPAAGRLLAQHGRVAVLIKIGSNHENQWSTLSSN